MANEPREPENWRDWVKADYEYPDDDWDDLSRAQRRRARKTWRRQDHAQRMSWLREQRGAEPSSPAGILVAVVLLAVIVLGIGGLIPRLLNRGGEDQPSVGLLTPANPPAVLPTEGIPSQPATSSSASPSSAPTSAPSSTPSGRPSAPVVTARLSKADLAAANRAAGAWAKVFYTRNPATETYEQLVVRAGEYTTEEVVASFTSAGDSTYEALKSTGGSSKVLAATTASPRPHTAPVDTPSRVTRLLTISIQVTGTSATQLNLPLLVTLVPQGDRWLISDVNGGAGT
jgi:hypothetical protein